MKETIQPLLILALSISAGLTACSGAAGVDLIPPAADRPTLIYFYTDG